MKNLKTYQKLKTSLIEGFTMIEKQAEGFLDYMIKENDIETIDDLEMFDFEESDVLEWLEENK